MNKVYKQFLSQREYEYGSAAYTIVCEDIIKHKYDEEVQAELKVTDCSRSISLDFGFRNYGEFKERINKLNELIKIAEKMKEDLTEVYNFSITRENKIED